jgi:uncharacterized membrane protein
MESRLKRLTRWLCGLLYIGAGVNHFVNPSFYVAIMPPYLPWHAALVYASGVAEVVLGAMLLVERLRVVAAWGLVALLIAVFPANVHMALHPELYPTIPVAGLWLRLPLQGVLVLWVLWYARGETSRVLGRS